MEENGEGVFDHGGDKTAASPQETPSLLAATDTEDAGRCIKQCSWKDPLPGSTAILAVNGAGWGHAQGC